jgi:DNA-binding CsgD family transcriptional regulator
MPAHTDAPASAEFIAQFSGLLLDLYRDASLLPADRFQAQVFTRLKALVPFDEAWWALGLAEAAPRTDAEYEGPQIFDIYLHGVSQENYELYKKLKRFDTVVLKAERNPGVTLNVCMRDWYPETHWPILDVYGYAHLLATHAIDPVIGLSSAITLYRRDPDRPFNERERLIKQALMPHWIAALNRNKIAPWIRDGAHVLNYPAAAILDPEGGLRYATEVFGEMLRREWPDWRGPVLPEPLRTLLDSSADGQFSGKHIAAKITLRQHMPLIQVRSKLLADQLSEQQLKVARHAADGLNFKEIARLMDLSPATVRYYLTNIYRKLGVKNKVQLVEIMREVE